jgi:hypothetical protein
MTKEIIEAARVQINLYNNEVIPDDLHDTQHEAITSLLQIVEAKECKWSGDEKPHWVPLPPHLGAKPVYKMTADVDLDILLESKPGSIIRVDELVVEATEWQDIEQEIIECMKNKDHRSFAYLQEDGGEIIIKGNLSDNAALRFIKMIITERPMVQRKLKGWKPKPSPTNQEQDND